MSFISTLATAKSKPQRVGIMTYNVENLFDTKHDEGKEDYTFLPVATKKESKETQKYCRKVKVPKWRDQCFELDWSDKVLDQKMKNIADAVLQVNDGKGPDILILEEVENITVLQHWVDQYLKPANYKTVILIEGKDERGIDVGIVSRFEKTSEPVLHPIPFTEINKTEKMDTRGILEAHLQLPDHSEIIVYANHFPAPFHKTTFRAQAYQYLDELMKEKPAGALQVAGGDFNTTSKENKKEDLLGKYVETDWIVAHEKGYQGDQGTSYYPKDKTWSFLDMLLLSKSFDSSKTWKWNPATYKIANEAKGQTSAEGFPQSFDTATGVGMSDHLPVYIEIQK